METVFGNHNGSEIYSVVIGNESIEAELLTLGATLRSLRVKDRNGNMTDVVLGYDSVEEYTSSNGYFGEAVGRVANRIGCASFELNGQRYSMIPNERDKNLLHGGKNGFHFRVWEHTSTDTSVTFTTFSPDGEGGFPGNLKVAITYSVKGSSLIIEYVAESDKDTPVSLTNHAYFNLSGHTGGEVYSHTLKVNADTVTEVDDELIPTGRLTPVEGTALDLREAKTLGDVILSSELSKTKGIDHNFALNGDDAAELYSPETGIVMKTLTTLEGIQIYTAGSLTRRTGKGGARYDRHNAVCLETQHFPDAVNKPGFPSCIIKKGVPDKHVTEYAFSVRSDEE
jgi:aldose 1-epimerase